MDYHLKAEPGKFKMILLSPTIKVESNYLLRSRKELCQSLLKNETLDEADILEFLLALHIVLEVGINTFFRSFYGMVPDLDYVKEIYLIDEVGFAEKTKLFLTTSKFTFRDGSDVKAASGHVDDILDSLKIFNNVRNMIIHGHSVSESSLGAVSKKSKLKGKLSESYMKEQIARFKKIIGGYNFFIDRLDTFVAPDQIKQFQVNFVSSDFLS